LDIEVAVLEGKQTESMYLMQSAPFAVLPRKDSAARDENMLAAVGMIAAQPPKR
jgi:hypothetical protein